MTSVPQPKFPLLCQFWEELGSYYDVGSSGHKMSDLKVAFPNNSIRLKVVDVNENVSKYI